MTKMPCDRVTKITYKGPGFEIIAALEISLWHVV
jgi:hypothetical protein